MLSTKLHFHLTLTKVTAKGGVLFRLVLYEVVRMVEFSPAVG